jgi:5'-nucleotidase / UDP-sugar diphosphatase
VRRSVSSIRSLPLGMVAIIAAGLVLLAGSAIAETRLTILHTNDTHGHLVPFSYPSIVDEGSQIAELPQRKDIGGIARRATLAAGLRSDLTKQGITVWMVDVGDFCDGSAFSTEYHGEADIAAMNKAGYDFGTIGNHEFNNTLPQLKKLINAATYTILCANATDRQTGKPLVTPYTIQKVGPVRIGLFGIVTTESGTYPAAKEGVDIADDTGAAREMVDKLRNGEKVDIVILLSHCGESADERIARDVPGIDVIVGGHSHSRLPLGDFVWRNDELRRDDVNGTVIVQAFQWGGDLGRCDLLFEKNAAGAWRVDRYRERLIPVTKEFADDPAVAAVVDGFWKPIAAKYGEVVGTATADFSDRGDDMAPYNLVADAVRQAYAVDVDFENLGGVRAPIIAGPITRADLSEVDPFQNSVILFSMKGSEIRRLLARSSPAVSGIRYRLFDDRLEEATVAGAPLDDARVYKCATNSYYAGRLRDYDLIDRKDTGKMRSDVLLEHVRKVGTITPAYDGRRVVVKTK